MLHAIKLIHTIVWAFFVATIGAIPVFAWRGNYGYAGLCIAIVFLEVIVLLLNKWSCPLTGVAARYTNERADNFDIYLPERLARYNKLVFGTLYGAGVLFTVARWIGWIRL